MALILDHVTYEYGSGTELSDILETIEKQQFVEPGRLLEHFWEVFVSFVAIMPR